MVEEPASEPIAQEQVEQREQQAWVADAQLLWQPTSGPRPL